MFKRHKKDIGPIYYVHSFNIESNLFSDQPFQGEYRLNKLNLKKLPRRFETIVLKDIKAVNSLDSFKVPKIITRNIYFARDFKFNDKPCLEVFEKVRCGSILFTFSNEMFNFIIKILKNITSLFNKVFVKCYLKFPNITNLSEINAKASEDSSLPITFTIYFGNNEYQILKTIASNISTVFKNPNCCRISFHGAIRGLPHHTFTQNKLEVYYELKTKVDAQGLIRVIDGYRLNKRYDMKITCKLDTKYIGCSLLDLKCIFQFLKHTNNYSLILQWNLQDRYADQKKIESFVEIILLNLLYSSVLYTKFIFTTNLKISQKLEYSQFHRVVWMLKEVNSRLSVRKRLSAQLWDPDNPDRQWSRWHNRYLNDIWSSTVLRLAALSGQSFYENILASRCLDENLNEAATWINDTRKRQFIKQSPFRK